MTISMEDAEITREELYKSLADLNQRIAVLDEARTTIRQAIKRLEMEVARGTEDRKTN
jgi:prefoldin subunit 5